MSAERTQAQREAPRRENPPFPGSLDHVGPFEVRGVLGTTDAGGPGEPVTVGWKDGEIYGDEAALILLRMKARIFDGVPLGPPTGPFTETEEQHLSSPVTVFELLKTNVFSEVVSVEGSEPVPRASGGRIP